MRVLVTGSAGFVGQEMVRLMRRRGHHVTGVDVLDDHLSDEFIKHDLVYPLDISSSRFDTCVHLASGVGGILFNVEQDDLVQTNDAINRTVVEACDAAGCRRIVFFSSINVFERNPTFIHGALQQADQISPYAISKARGEATIASDAGRDTMVIRPTNIFGKSQVRRHERYGESHVIPDLLHKIDTEQVLEVFGDGSQIRNFVHVVDVCRFVVDNLGSVGHTYFNLRSDITVSVAELAESLMAHRRKRLRLVFRPEYMNLELFRIEPFDMSLPEQYGWHSTVRSVAEGLCL